MKRNLLKRQVREVFRTYQHDLPSVDLVVGLRSSPYPAANAELREDLSVLFRRAAGATS